MNARPTISELLDKLRADEAAATGLAAVESVLDEPDVQAAIERKTWKPTVCECGSTEFEPYSGGYACKGCDLIHWAMLNDRPREALIAVYDEATGLRPPTDEELAQGINREPSPYWNTGTPPEPGLHPAGEWAGSSAFASVDRLAGTVHPILWPTNELNQPPASGSTPEGSMNEHEKRLYEAEGGNSGFYAKTAPRLVGAERNAEPAGYSVPNSLPGAIDRVNASIARVVDLSGNACRLADRLGGPVPTTGNIGKAETAAGMMEALHDALNALDRELNELTSHQRRIEAALGLD